MSNASGLYGTFWYVDSIKTSEGEEQCNIKLGSKRRMGFKVDQQKQSFALFEPANQGSTSDFTVEFSDATKGKIDVKGVGMTERGAVDPDDKAGSRLMSKFPFPIHFELKDSDTLIVQGQDGRTWVLKNRND